MAPFSRQAVHFVVLAALAFSSGRCGPVANPENDAPTKTEGQKTATKDPTENKKDQPDPSVLTRSNIAKVSEDPFVFPGEEPPSLTNKNSDKKPEKVKDIPPCADGSSFCSDVEGYPEDYINTVLTNRIDEFHELFEGDNKVEEPGIGHKLDPTTDLSLCPAVTQDLPIRGARNKLGDWRIVVNHGNFSQKITVETCVTNKNALRNSDCSKINLGYRTECMQKHMYQKLVSMDNKKNLMVDTFPLPSCCSCILKTNLFTRIAPLNKLMTPAQTTKKP